MLPDKAKDRELIKMEINFQEIILVEELAIK